MRDKTILFRVWDVEKKSMIYFNAFEEWGIIDHTKSKVSRSVSGNSLHISTDPDQFKWMRYVGVKDMNDNRIYVGDVVVLLKERREYFRGAVMDHGHRGITIDTPSDYMEFELDAYQYKVVGNIFNGKVKP